MTQILHDLYDNVTISPTVIRIATSHANLHQMEPLFYDKRIDDMINLTENCAAIKITMKLDDFLDMEKILSKSVTEKQQREADPRLKELYNAYQTFLHLSQ